ncbi:protein-arginine omega-N asymmetric methyltransferase [Aureococcus anophagefferens]|nr:protein-arginine omega-N asymmetric methyltransferase [Aureococcus anophagefferens]
MARPRLAGCAARRLALVLLAFRASCYDRPRVVRLHPGPRLAAHAEYEVSWTATDLGTADEAWIEFDLKHYQSMAAARLGARKVYAIEAVPASAARARKEVSDAAKYGREFAEGVVEVLEGFSTDVALPEKVDLVIFEIAGYIPHAYQTLGAPATDLCHHGGGVEDPGAPVLRVQSDDATLRLLADPLLVEDIVFSAPLPARGAVPPASELAWAVDGARVDANEAHFAGLLEPDRAPPRPTGLQQTATVLAAMVSVHRRLVALCVVGVVGVARGRETRLAKASGPPSFFLQDAAADGLCLGDGAFKRCGIDTLWYVTGSAGAYSIHKRKVDDVDEDLCLDRASCDLPEAARRCRRSSAPGADPAAGDKDNITALMEAAIGGHADVAARLLEAAPASLDAAAASGVISALARGRARAARRRRAPPGRGADASNARSDGITALMAAATGGHAAVVARAGGAGVAAADRDGLTGAHERGGERHGGGGGGARGRRGRRRDVGDGLHAAHRRAAGATTPSAPALSTGADAGRRHDEGVDALMYAAAGGHASTAALLVARGADVAATPPR